MDDEKLEQRIKDLRNNLTTDRLDMSYGEIINMYQSGDLIISPEFQRLFRWKNFQKTRFIESIFMLFPWKTSHKTIYHNPNFTGFQLQCGGYGSIPSVSMATTTDPLFVTLCQNAMNLNGSVSGLNKEVIRSLTTNFSESVTRGVKSDEETSFFLGLPTETDNCFQQGMTSNTPITFEVHVKQNSGNPYMTSVEATPIMCFLVDSTFSVQVQPNGAPPLVELGAYDITSPVET